MRMGSMDCACDATLEPAIGRVNFLQRVSFRLDVG
jgi:hypothetical protein